MSLTMQLFSHPDKLLYEHLKETAEIALGKLKTITNGQFLISNVILYEVIYISCALHDIGKATTYFQKYLLEEGNPITGPKNHALLSALIAKEIVESYLQYTTIEDIYKKVIPFFVFTAIKRHHGMLNNFEDELANLEQKKEELLKQLGSFNFEDIEQLIEDMLSGIEYSVSLTLINQKIVNGKLIEEYNDFIVDVFTLGEYDDLDDLKKYELFYIHNLLYSLLLASDKKDVIIKKEVQNLPDINLEYIEKFRQKKCFGNSVKRIDELKNKAFFESIENMDKIFSKHNFLYSLTLPTGLGKTITSFAVALKLINLVDDRKLKIIISIPFTSIIDQNYEVYKEILDNPDSLTMLKHHHLSEPEYKINESIEDYNKSQFLIESWESKVVVTTFVQFLESLVSNNKSRLLKIPNICNSIIILDEVQNIPYKFWQLIKIIFETISKKYNCYFILMSATQPLIFEPDKEITEIVPNYKEYFLNFNRTRLIPMLKENFQLSEFVDFIADYAEKFKNKDILVILNTKNSSKNLFLEVIEKVIDTETTFFYLSTLKTPYERKEIINKIKKQKDKRKIIITTQLIEAGVDISVDTVFREIAPLDSIIQAAGRANRYSEKKEISDVFIIKISETIKTSNRIYGPELISKTENLLKNYNTIEEKEYLTLIEKYYKLVKTDSDNSKNEFVSYLKTLKFKELSGLNLIESRDTEPVFIQLNKNAVTVWKDYVNIYSDDSLNQFEKEERFSKIKATFYDFVINVPVPFGSENNTIVFDSVKQFGFYVSELDNPSQFYSYSPDEEKLNTGYSQTSILSF